MDIKTLPKWARSIINQKDARILELEEANAALRLKPLVAEPVGTVLLGGYGSEPLPVGKYFQVQVGDLVVCLRGDVLAVTCALGSPAAVPGVSNVLHIVHLPKGALE